MYQCSAVLCIGRILRVTVAWRSPSRYFRKHVYLSLIYKHPRAYTKPFTDQSFWSGKRKGYIAPTHIFSLILVFKLMVARCTVDVFRCCSSSAPFRLLLKLCISWGQSWLAMKINVPTSISTDLFQERTWASTGLPPLALKWRVYQFHHLSTSSNHTQGSMTLSNQMVNYLYSMLLMNYRDHKKLFASGESLSWTKL